MEPTLDQVRQDLADIHEGPLALPANAFDRRVELKEGQNELPQLSHGLVEGQPLHNAKALGAAFNRLEELRDRLLKKRSRDRRDRDQARGDPRADAQLELIHG